MGDRLLRFADFPVGEALLAEARGLGLATVPLETLLAGEALPHVEGLLPLITHRVDAAVMDKLPNLKVIANYGAGYNNIDVAEASRLGVVVTNTPGVLCDDTADLTWGLILAACRRMGESERVMRRQAFTGWTPFYQLGVPITGQTLGIVGMGEIGQKVARRAAGFEMPVLYTQRNRLPEGLERELNATYVAFDNLVRHSDIVSIHTPLTEATRHLFHAGVFEAMKPTAVLINTSRGPVVDEVALAEALRCGKLFAAGLDVFENEPQVYSGLLTLENVVLTAHIGSATHTTRQAMGNLALQNALAILAGQSALTPVFLASA